MAQKKTKEIDKISYVWASLRIIIGLIFLWAFFDKMFGLGYATCQSINPETHKKTITIMCDQAVIKGGSATYGFLKFGAHGPLQNFYAGLAGNGVADFLFMAGMGLIGTALILGIGIKVATTTGSLLMLMIWLALLPGENNPLLDEHIVYIAVLIGIRLSNSHQVWGLGNWWQRQNLVKKYPILS